MSTNILPLAWMRTLAILACVLVPGVCAAAGGDSLIGQWRPQDDPAAVVDIRAQQDGYAGRLAAHGGHPEYVGTELLRNLRWQAQDGRWRGQVYSLKLKKLLNADLVPDGPDRFTLEVDTWFGKHRVKWERSS